MLQLQAVVHLSRFTSCDVAVAGCFAFVHVYAWLLLAFKLLYASTHLPEGRVSGYQENLVKQMSHMPCCQNATRKLLHCPAVRTTLVCGLVLSTGGLARGQDSTVCYHLLIDDLYMMPSGRIR